ncbi:MAG: hypothetical protein L6R42_008577, partial [Xanthoria sp. 1 TBL-2021]
KMTKWYFLQRSDTEDVLEAVNQVITEFNITDGNIEPRRDEKQDVLPEKPPPQAAKRDLDALQDQSPNVQANVAAPAKRQHRAPKKGGPSKH